MVRRNNSDFASKGDEDQAVLKRYREPAWNNPVVRLPDPAGKDVPPWLGLLSRESVALKNGVETAVFGMS